MRWLPSLLALLGFVVCACSNDESSKSTEEGDGSASGGTAGAGTGGTAGGGGGGAAGSGTGGTVAIGGPCASEEDCTGATSHCDLASGMCVGCTSDADCLGALHCDTATGICRDCVTDEHCGGAHCDPVSRQCTVFCTTDADCAGGGPGVCDTTAGRGVCVDCTGNGQFCPFCELETYSCVGCLQDTDCPPSAAYCGPSYECSPACTTDTDCPGGLFCDPATSRCLECVINLHCGGETCQPDHTCG